MVYAMKLGFLISLLGSSFGSAEKREYTGRHRFVEDSLIAGSISSFNNELPRTVRVQRTSDLSEGTGSTRNLKSKKSKCSKKSSKKKSKAPNIFATSKSLKSEKTAACEEDNIEPSLKPSSRPTLSPTISVAPSISPAPSQYDCESPVGRARDATIIASEASSAENLNSPSPQKSALEWLINEDTSNACDSDIVMTVSINILYDTLTSYDHLKA
jgi:hypothetical protein